MDFQERLLNCDSKCASFIHSFQAFSRKKSSSIVPESIPDEKFVNNKTEIKDIPCPLVFPKKVPYLIIGGGTASWSAFRAIKDHVPNAKVPFESF